MPRTAAQAAASRQNGARSHGPVTPAGKAASAQNARTHDLCSDLSCTDFEDFPAFDELADRLYAVHRPEDAQEDELVRAIVLASWQVRRAQELDVQFWSWNTHGLRDDQLRHVRQLDGEDRHGRRTLATVMRYQARAEMARGRALRDLALYRSGRLERVAAAAVPKPKTDRTDEPEARICTNEPERREECTNEPEMTAPQPDCGLR